SISFTKNGRGHKVIDVSELSRVYEIIKTPEEIKKSKPVKSDNKTSVNLSSLEKELASLREELISSHERERNLLSDQIETLKNTLDEERENNKKVIRLLEDKRGEGTEKAFEEIETLRTIVKQFQDKEEAREQRREQRRKERI